MIKNSDKTLFLRAEKTIKKGTKSESPKLVVLMGLPGSGKSHVSNYLHEKYGFTVLSGENISFAIFNKVDCTGAEYSLSYDILRQLATKLISQGYSVVIDGTNLKYIFRQQIYNEVNCPDTTILYLKVNDNLALNRVSQRGVNFKDSKNIKSQISPETFDRFKNQLEEPLHNEKSITLMSDDNLLAEIDSVFGVK
ncbi:MAG: ATP-binding protein [Candidatus Shapirobacteria bacterium]